MKCVILAGGFAKRLWPITLDKAKSLLPVGDKLLIDYVFENIRRAGIVDVYVSTNQRFADSFREWGKDKGVEIIVEPTRSEKEKLGSLGALNELFAEQGFHEDCLVIAGDNILTFELKGFVNAFKGNLLVALYDLGSTQNASRYGVVEVDAGKVTGFEEKPESPKSSLISTACYLYPSHCIDLLSEYLSAGHNKDAPGFFIEWLHKREEVNAFVFKGKWYDVGDRESYLKANLEIYGKAYVHPSSKAIRSVLKNCIVLENAEVHDSELENCVVGPGVILHNVKKENELLSNDAKDNYE